MPTGSQLLAQSCDRPGDTGQPAQPSPQDLPAEALGSPQSPSWGPRLGGHVLTQAPSTCRCGVGAISSLEFPGALAQNTGSQTLAQG